MIRIESLSFSYRDDAVFKDLSFATESDGITAILGLNGAGKTTFLKLLLGLLRPDKGSIFIGDNDIAGLSFSKRAALLSYVPQESDPSLHMNVIDFVCLGGIFRQDIFKGPSANDRERALAILDELDASSFAQKDISALSSGQRRLIYLARAIFQDSEVMVLDEPATSLDLLNQHRFLKQLRKIAYDTGKQIVMSIHDPCLAYGYADRFLIFKYQKLLCLIERNGEDFANRFISAIEKLYDDEVEAVLNDGQLQILYRS